MDDGRIKPASYDTPIDLQVQRRLADIGRLVSLPQTTIRLLSLLSEENTSFKDLQTVVESDPALTAKLISLSNSPIYAPREPVSTIQRAIAIIGFNELETLALGVGLSETFDFRNAPENFDSQALWTHCLAVSWISRELAQITGAVESSEAMIGGLLHELGILILISKFPVHFQQIMDLINSGMSLRQAEVTLSLRHEVIGYHLARNWALPEIFQKTILFHHDPDSAGNFQIIASIVALADNLAHKCGYDIKLESLEINLPPILQLLNMPVEKLHSFIKMVVENMPKVERLWTQIISTAVQPPPKTASLTSLMT
ncbi:MAG: HDOD domain-containing protein [Deltaproteobacteria bacterium]|jgi:HD-like signal output (HDOD) protein|nr:HDOD domain-containing protein [Deltaproteobacteria bacterium]